MPSDLCVFSTRVPESLCVLLEEIYHARVYTNGLDLLRVSFWPANRDANASLEMKIDGAGSPSRAVYQLSHFSDYFDQETLYSKTNRKQQQDNYNQLSKYFCGLDKYYTDEQGILRPDRSEENVLACVEKMLIFHAARTNTRVDDFKRCND